VISYLKKPVQPDIKNINKIDYIFYILSINGYFFSFGVEYVQKITQHDRPLALLRNGFKEIDGKRGVDPVQTVERNGDASARRFAFHPFHRVDVRRGERQSGVRPEAYPFLGRFRPRTGEHPLREETLQDPHGLEKVEEVAFPKQPPHNTAGLLSPGAIPLLCLLWFWSFH